MNNPILDLIEKQNEINASAWVTFNEDFERRNPPPKIENRAWWYRAVALGGIAALTVSGSFTVPSFFKISLATGALDVIAFFVGIAGFIMVDMISMIGAHELVNIVYRPQAMQGKMNNRALVIAIGIMTAYAFIIGVGSNLYYMLYGFDVLVDGSQGLLNLSISLGVLMAFAPPILSASTGAIIALVPLQSIIEKEAYETSKNRAWLRYQKKMGIQFDVEQLTERYMDNAMNRLEYVPEKQIETVSNSFSSANTAQSLNQKAALVYIKDNESQYETVAKTVIEQNPTANQTDIAKAIASEMTGDERGYMTVIRAYKKLGKSIPGLD